MTDIHEIRDRKHKYELEIYHIIPQLEELLKLQEENYEPYKQQQTKTAIRALLNVVGIKNLKAFHRGDN